MTRFFIRSAAMVALLVVSAQPSVAGHKSKGHKVFRQVQQGVQQLQTGTFRPQQVVQPYQVTVPSGPATRQVIIGPGSGQPQLAFFSSRLGARFEVQSIQIGAFSPVWAARIVSEPQPGSPLQQLGLRIGDVITRLDGIPVTHTAELDRHVYDTQVRFIRAGSQYVEEGTMFVDAGRYFQETLYPPYFPGNSSCHQGGLRP